MAEIPSFSCTFSKSFAIVLILVSIVATCEGYFGRIAPDPEKPGECIYHDETLKLGSNPGSGPCQRLTCLEDGSIIIEGCGKVRIESCNQGERLYSDKPYPECCKLKYKCKRVDGSSFFITKDMAEQVAKTENSA